MDVDELFAVAAETALALPDARLEFPFGPDFEVYRVRGKVFMIPFVGRGVTLKCDPDHARHLREHFASIGPGYHMNKRHWITVAAGPDITPDLVEELVCQSWELVVEKMPRAQRPPLPDWSGDSGQHGDSD
ncbi:MAG: MmcQ/YjbR family DNA-binding protein [Actinomycetaceae bacterium]|nr:MmcQ/YjbR family DNA-binding protein [Actinomycetaceae bacterium]